MTFMITSRSCPHKCSFCSVHTTFGTDYRRRSLENVLEEIVLRYQQGYRVIDFEDDNLTYYKQTFKELCRRLIAHFPRREMEFVAMNGISYLSLDDELLELMYQAGFSHLNLALVSLRQNRARNHQAAAHAGSLFERRSTRPISSASRSSPIRFSACQTKLSTA